VQICVSATAPGNTFATYSNYGTNAINVAAPGGGDAPATWVLGLCSSRSTHPEFAPCKDRVSYLIAQGTSGAAPHVSGLAALLDSQFGGALNASQLITAIQQNADDLGKPGADPFFGKGQINAARTVSGTP
jgi:subtilisin family serine protease